MPDYQSQALSLVQSSLQAGSNPYEALDDFLWQQVVPEVPASFRAQLIFLAVVLGLCLVLVLASLVVRAVQGTFWIAHRGTSPSLIRPHFSVAWSLWAVVLLILLEVDTGLTIRYYERSIISCFIALKTVAWLPAWYGGFTAAWGIAVSYLLHLSSYGHQQRVERLAPYVNAGALAIPLVFSAVMIPLSAISSRHFVRVIHAFRGIDSLLQQRAASYRGDFSIADLAPGLPPLRDLEAQTQLFKRWFGITFAAFTCSAFVVGTLLAGVSFLYLISLRTSLKIAEAHVQGSTATSCSRQRKLMQRTYLNLIITVAAFSILAILFGVDSALIAANPGGIARSSPTQLFHLLGYYPFAIFGFPTAILLIVRSFDRTSSHHQSSPSNSRNRSGEVSVSVVHDSARDAHMYPGTGSLRLPYQHARAAFSLPLPENFELVEPKEKADSPSNDEELVYPSGLLVAPSPGFAPESPIVGYRWSDSARTSLPSAVCSPPPSRPLSMTSMSESLRAHRSSTAAFTFLETDRLDAAEKAEGLDKPVGRWP
ncbi:hypothetical protein JCM10213_007942 [Rhodosporidiobolus nylandii]